MLYLIIHLIVDLMKKRLYKFIYNDSLEHFPTSI